MIVHRVETEEHRLAVRRRNKMYLKCLVRNNTNTTQLTSDINQNYCLLTFKYVCIIVCIRRYKTLNSLFRMVLTYLCRTVTCMCLMYHHCLS